MEKVETLGRRLSQLMEERSLNYDRLGRLLDMKPQTLNRYVLGQREPKARVATEMAMKLEVDPMWLQGYDVPKSAPAAAAGGCMVPVLRRFCAGVPLSQQEPLGYFPADVTGAEGFFYLTAPDDRMAGAGIRSGDLVLIRQQSIARSGQIVLCSDNGEDGVLRRFHQQGDWVILQPEAPNAVPRLLYATEFDTGKLRIIGVAVSLTRQLEPEAPF